MQTSLYIWISPLEITYLCMYVSKAKLIFTSAGFGHCYSKYGAPGPPQSSPYCTELYRRVLQVLLMTVLPKRTGKAKDNFPFLLWISPFDRLKSQPMFKGLIRNVNSEITL